MKNIFTIAALIITIGSLSAQDRSRSTFVRDRETGETIEIRNDRSQRGLEKLSNTRLDYALSRAHYWSSRMNRLQWKHFGKRVKRMTRHLSTVKIDGDWYARDKSVNKRKAGLIKIN